MTPLLSAALAASIVTCFAPEQGLREDKPAAEVRRATADPTGDTATTSA